MVEVKADGFVIYPDGKVVWYKTDDPDTTPPADFGFLVCRANLVEKRSW